MDYRYNIITEVLGMVRQSGMSVKEKLCAETLLYQTKRRLLHSSKLATRQQAVGDCDFENLLLYAHSICCGECDAEKANTFNAHIQSILSSLSNDGHHPS